MNAVLSMLAPISCSLCGYGMQSRTHPHGNGLPIISCCPSRLLWLVMHCAPCRLHLEPEYAFLLDAFKGGYVLLNATSLIKLIILFATYSLIVSHTIYFNTFIL